jgi:hypothetical protein
MLSSIAHQLLFRDVSLQFMTSRLDAEGDDLPFNPIEMDKWHTQRSAEILQHLASDLACASQVRSFMVWTPVDSGIPSCRNMGMLTFPTKFPLLIDVPSGACYCPYKTHQFEGF